MDEYNKRRTHWLVIRDPLWLFTPFAHPEIMLDYTVYRSRKRKRTIQIPISRGYHVITYRNGQNEHSYEVYVTTDISTRVFFGRLMGKDMKHAMCRRHHHH